MHFTIIGAVAGPGPKLNADGRPPNVKISSKLEMAAAAV